MTKTLPKIALGAWAWGNDGTFGDNWTADSLRPIFDAAMKAGLNLWDTAYVYGMGTWKQNIRCLASTTWISTGCIIPLTLQSGLPKLRSFLREKKMD